MRSVEGISAVHGGEEVKRAQLHLLSARDASHRWEGVQHPLHQNVTTETLS